MRPACTPIAVVSAAKRSVERHQLHLDAAFLLLVGERLAHAERCRISWVGKADFIVLVIGGAGPEPNGVDRRRIGPIFAFGGEFGLVRVDPGLVLGAVDAGDVIERCCFA